MNLIGFDAMALGNHEFDDGPVTLASFVRVAEFPVLAASVVPVGASPLRGLLAPSVVLERDGALIGVIGAVTASTAETSSGGGVRFLSPSAMVRGEAARLAAEGVDKIVVLSHICISADRMLALEVGGIDAIVGGHSHTRMGAAQDGAQLPYPLVARGPDGE